MKRWLGVAACLLAGLSLARAEDVLRVYNWADYIDPTVIEDFQRARGVKVDYRTFTDATELADALSRGETFDLVFPTNHQLHDLVKNGLIVPLDAALLHNRSNLDPYLLKLLAGSGAQNHVAPYMWGTVGLMVNQPLAERYYGGPLPNSWSLLFDRQATDRLSACGVAILNAGQEAVSLKMTYKGLRLGNSSARRIGHEIAGLLNPGVHLSPINYTRFIEQMANGELCVAMTWDALLRGADLEQRGLRFSIPKEGGLIFIDSMAIPTKAQQPELAHAFIDFLLDPVNVARNVRVSHAIPGIRESLLAGDGTASRLNIDNKMRKRLYLLDSFNERQRQALQAAWPPHQRKPDAPVIDP
ncbi:extracellular solute-binding protein [Pseudomonas sp. CC6-YY-74]|uniref:extracellular solute-binding protein n=1 Tax=Pseudomonas sp. CC6-YY-74 TaxID=1930532 RepID=UPI0009A20AD5|nr:extracellular solute-binding protein [Pseudomonas sp. CC6-YY-74]